MLSGRIHASAALVLAPGKEIALVRRGRPGVHVIHEDEFKAGERIAPTAAPWLGRPAPLLFRHLARFQLAAVVGEPFARNLAVGRDPLPPARLDMETPLTASGVAAL